MAAYVPPNESLVLDLAHHHALVTHWKQHGQVSPGAAASDCMKLSSSDPLGSVCECPGA